MTIPEYDKDCDCEVCKCDRTDRQDALDRAHAVMNRLEKRYQEKHPCPECGSHNVHIEIDNLCGGYVQGREWCDDCKWEQKTDTFPKEK